MCAAYQLPHSAFLAWSKDDRDKAIWQLARARSRCGRCGTRPEEWDETRGGDRNAYYAEPYRCRGCELLDQQQDHVTAQAKTLGRGIYVRLTRTQEVTRA